MSNTNNRNRTNYSKVASQIEEITSCFLGGESLISLTRKHSLPLKVIETVIRMKLMARNRR